MAKVTFRGWLSDEADLRRQPSVILGENLSRSSGEKSAKLKEKSKQGEQAETTEYPGLSETGVNQ